MLELGRDITGDFTPAESREWLCTNGIGGFAPGTIAGSLARRYHGLLVAALAPPLRPGAWPRRCARGPNSRMAREGGQGKIAP